MRKALFVVLHTNCKMYAFPYKPNIPNMKHLIISTAFTVICYSVIAQIKKPDSSKKNGFITTGHPSLAQQKIWPVNNSFKNNDSYIINSGPVVKTRTRL
jgi:rRNA-processing protein FCF1